MVRFGITELILLTQLTPTVTSDKPLPAQLATYLFGFRLWQISIPLDLHRGREREETAVVGSHVLGNTSGPLKSFEVTLRSWGTAEVVQPADDLEHGSKAEFAHCEADALMRSKAEMRVQAHVPIQFYLFGVGECHWVMGCCNLYVPVSTCLQMYGWSVNG